MSDPALQRFVACGPWPQRAALRALLDLARRPRGAALIDRLPVAADLAHSLIAMTHYEHAERSAALGFDADAVAARGRAAQR